MSDVIVTTTNSVTDVTTTDDVTNINITETVVEVSASTAGVQGVPGVNSDPIYVIVRNKSGATLSKGAMVYTSGANGTHTQVSLANASSDATSARTLGWVVSDILNNADGLVCVEGYIDGINTQGITEGAQLYLSGTVSGGFTETKPVAPIHMVYVGVCSKASAGNGRVYVKVQNGYELDELHNVKITNPQNNDLLQYVSGTALWENVAATAVSVGSATNAGTATYATTSGTATYATNSGTATYATTSGTAVSISGSITKSQVSDFTSGTVASASTAQQAGTATYATNSGTAVYSNTSGTSVYATNAGTAVYATNAGTSVYADTSGTSVYATNAGTSVYATNSGTSVYATTSGTAVSISGSITRSQVSDYASGTVANISGTVTQSQVSGLATALAGKAGLADNNTFSGLNTFSNFTTFQAAADAIPVRIFGVNGQSADLFSVNDYLTNTQFEILSDGRAQSLKGIIATVSSTASVPLVVRGTAGQSANLLEIQDSTNATAIRVNSSGSLVYGYASGSLLSANGRILAVASTATVVPATFKGATSQTANLTEWQDSSGSTAVYVKPSGSLYFNSNNNTVGVEFLGSAGTQYITANGNDLGIRPRYDVLFSPADSAGRLRPSNDNTSDLGTSGQRWKIVYSSGASIVNSGTALVPLTVRGASGQSAALQQWQNSGGTTTSQISADGTLFASRFAYFGSVQTAGLSNAVVSVVPTSATNIPVAIRGAASQSADLQQWQDSTGGTPLAVSSTYGLVGRNAGTVSFALSSQNGLGAFYLQSASQVGLIVRGAASQTADLQQWQNSSGATALSVNSAGLVTGTRAFTINQSNSGEYLLRLAGASGQTGDYLQVRDSGANTLASISSGGIIYGTQIRGLSSLVLLTEASGGGLLTMARATATPSNPGANTARLYLRDGTNAGTLKLVVRAGAAGAETTILDNIPQS